jgi:hypothetical protein
MMSWELYLDEIKKIFNDLLLLIFLIRYSINNWWSTSHHLNILYRPCIKSKSYYYTLYNTIQIRFHKEVCKYSLIYENDHTSQAACNLSFITMKKIFIMTLPFTLSKWKKYIRFDFSSISFQFKYRNTH